MIEGLSASWPTDATESYFSKPSRPCYRNDRRQGGIVGLGKPIRYNSRKRLMAEASVITTRVLGA